MSNKSVRKYYLSGAIASDPDYKAKFEDAANRLKEAAAHIEWLELAIMNPTNLPEGMSKKDYMMIDLQMVAASDAVILLPGWENSPGARIEKDFCDYIGKHTIPLQSLINSLKNWED